jgi:amidase
MKFAEYVRHDATGLAAAVRAGAVATAALEETALEAIAVLNPLLNAVIEAWPGEATAIPPDAAAPFAGVPFLIKDLVIGRAGRRQEMGSRLAVGNVAAANTYLMDRFDRLGLVTLGRTATPEFGHGPTTEPVHGGPTRNPWDLTRMAGGSSGGAGAAVAAGIVPLAHGNDGAGSIRIPAACCGLIGLKPSRGRVSSGPNNAETLFGMGVELALTRSIRDTAAVLDGVATPMPGDPFVILQPDAHYTELATRAPGRLRIAYTTTPWYDAPIDPEIVRAVEETARLCRDLGHSVIEASPVFDYTRMRSACLTLWAAGMAHWGRLLAAKVGRPLTEEHLEAATLAMIRFGSSLSAADLLVALEHTNAVTRTTGVFFEEYDLLLTPATAKVAQPLGTYDQNRPVTTHEDWFDRKARFPPFLALFNVTGQPAISLPVSAGDSGLPIGVQFAARFGREDVLLQLGHQLEHIQSWQDVLIGNQLRLWDEALKRR